ncbi:helix-turn-helix domain-containing protein [Streptomyces bauhiniae]|uniref:helix-turn-helix domain-containing protein n=1 Tax=Streptomyces bauhiniae TaxID=2340725 RepID=UPI0035DEFAD3
MHNVLSTKELSATERAEFWRNAVSDTFIPLDVAFLEDAPRAASIISRRLGPFQVSRVEAGPQRVARTSRLIARDGEEYLTLSLQHWGTARLEQDGGQVQLRRGTFTVSDSGRPFSKELPGAFGFTAFHWPRTTTGLTDRSLRALTATVFSSGTLGSTAGLVASHLSRLARGADSYSAETAWRLASTAIDLLDILAQEQLGQDLVTQPPNVVLVRVKDYMLRHLCDPDLTPERIASAHFISVRYLHRLFQKDGTTVGRWLLLRRLEMCRGELARATSVAATAGRWGFVSASHFSRVFKATYGCTPREWQAASQTADLLPAAV